MTVGIKNKQSTTYFLLALTHIVLIAATNFLVQIPIVIVGITVTCGIFSYPLVYLATDITVRLYGTRLARKIILTVMLPVLLMSYVISILFQHGSFDHWNTLAYFNLSIARVAFACFLVYLIGQVMDILIFNRLRQSTIWWCAPAGSAILGNFIDTLIFFTVAFYRSSNTFMAQHWMSIGLADYTYKVIVSLLFLLPLYRLLLNAVAKSI